MAPASDEDSRGEAGWPTALSGHGAGSAGAMLAAARKASGRDLRDIAEETRVSLRYLRAIEDDRHEDLPALPYALGFVRSYARCVGLDPEATASRFRSETTQRPHVPTPGALDRLDEQRLPSRGVVTASLAALTLTLICLSAWGAGLFSPAPDTLAEATPLPEAAIAGAAAPDPEPEAPAAAPQPSAAPQPGAAPPSGAAVTIEALDEVWVRIYEPSTQTVALSGILKAGDRFEVPRQPQGFRLWTGRAGALQLSLDGRRLPPLGGPAEVLKDISLAPSDLAARPTPSPEIIE
jgi:cytoskeletal protein RodZ